MFPIEFDCNESLLMGVITSDDPSMPLIDLSTGTTSNGSGTGTTTVPNIPTIPIVPFKASFGIDVYSRQYFGFTVPDSSQVFAVLLKDSPRATQWYSTYFSNLVNGAQTAPTKFFIRLKPSASDPKYVLPTDDRLSPVKMQDNYVIVEKIGVNDNGTANWTIQMDSDTAALFVNDVLAGLMSTNSNSFAIPVPVPIVPPVA